MVLVHKDRGTHCAALGFANGQTKKEIKEDVKRSRSERKLKSEDEFCNG